MKLTDGCLLIECASNNATEQLIRNLIVHLRLKVNNLLFLIIQEGRVNINLKTGHSLDAYAFGMFVSDILDTRADLGTVNYCGQYMFNWYKMKVSGQQICET